MYSSTPGTGSNILSPMAHRGKFRETIWKIAVSCQLAGFSSYMMSIFDASLPHPGYSNSQSAPSGVIPRCWCPFAMLMCHSGLNISKGCPMPSGGCSGGGGLDTCTFLPVGCYEFSANFHYPFICCERKREEEETTLKHARIIAAAVYHHHHHHRQPSFPLRGPKQGC